MKPAALLNGPFVPDIHFFTGLNNNPSFKKRIHYYSTTGSGLEHANFQTDRNLDSFSGWRFL